MTVTTKTLKSVYLETMRYHYSMACPGYSDYYTGQNFVKDQLVRADNPKESRPLPQDPRLSPTESPVQSTSLRKAGIIQYYKAQYNKLYCPGPGYVWYPYSSQALVQAPASLVVTLPSLDWETPLRLKIRDLSVNLGVTLAEYRQTASMFRQFGVGMFKAWKAFRGRLPSRSRITPCTIAASELVYSYGLEPLVSDLYDSLDVLQHRLQLPIWYKAKVKVKDRCPSFTKWVPNIGMYEGSWEVRTTATAYVKLKEDFEEIIFGNPLELAWEVIPFSFVVDWGIPVGDYLQALDALKGIEQSVGSVTTRKRWEQRLTDYRVVEDVMWSEVEPSTATHRQHQRNIITSIPLPRVPTWNPSKSWRAITHGLSLLTILNQRCQR